MIKDVNDIALWVKQALDEDIGSGDITAALIDPEKTAKATIITREPMVLCGKPWIVEVNNYYKGVSIHWNFNDGDKLKKKRHLMYH